MKKELTNEEIAKVYGMYIGCEIQIIDDKRTTLTGVLIGNNCVDLFYNSSQFAMTSTEYKLLLTPLSEITDEHAVQVAKILNVSFSNDPFSDLHFDTAGLAFYLNELFENNGDITDIPSFRVINCCQCLISRGYAVPLFFGIDHWATGKTAIELGIAIPNTPK